MEELRGRLDSGNFEEFDVIVYMDSDAIPAVFFLLFLLSFPWWQILILGSVEEVLQYTPPIGEFAAHANGFSSVRGSQLLLHVSAGGATPAHIHVQMPGLTTSMLVF